ncbi:MAG TPA: DUF4956 domain-containing protein [Vicinamibacterales bacterium]|jgi:hypothetical protein|nr:DUF4956 domain-containing protein [Vicinamibacterales bacterium]
MFWLRTILLALCLSAPVAAQVASPPPPADQSQTLDLSATDQKKAKHGDVVSDAPDWDTQIEQVKHALARLPIAAALAGLLALRPRRRGTPRRQLPVIQTQIILAVVGAVVMLVVGSSLARAFGIVGAAGLVRYRAKIEDPKDAGVMLSTLAIGLASGVGLWVLAAFATAFILVLLWIVESFEPKATQLFALKIKAKNSATLKPQIEELMARRQLNYELRTSSPEELSYDVHFPIDRKTANLSDQIRQLSADAAVEWEEKKEKK